MNAIAFDQDISVWNTDNVIYMENMFDGATLFSYDITHWAPSGSRFMFSGATTWLYLYTNCGRPTSDVSVCIGTYPDSSGDEWGPPTAWQKRS